MPKNAINLRDEVVRTSSGDIAIEHEHAVAIVRTWINQEVEVWLEVRGLGFDAELSGPLRLVVTDDERCRVELHSEDWAVGVDDLDPCSVGEGGAVSIGHVVIAHKA